MAIDPRIAMQLQVPDVAGAIRGGIDWHDQRQEKKTLADLLPQAAKGDQEAINKLYAIDPNIAMRMDDRQRAAAKELTSDLSSAVRWADSPEKWQQVQTFYGQRGVDLSPYRFEDRERGLMALGKLGEYLNGNPKEDLVVIDGVAMDKRTGQPKFESPYDRIISGPDGSFFRVPRIGIGRGGGMSATPQTAQPQQGGPQIGQVVNGFRFKGGNPNDRNAWEPVNGGPTPQASGPFQPSGY